MVNVIKWDGRKEPFQRKKVQRTLLRVGAPPEVAEKIARQIEEEAYEGITTKEILDMIFQRLEKYEPAVTFRKDLRTALGEMRPQPDFEEYVRIVLRAHGYKVTSERVIQGFCVSHEIDGIAEKDGETIYLEVKHHSEPHIYTPFDVTLATKAKWDDIKEGFKKGLNNQSFDRVLMVCNSRLTEHARKYSACVGIDHLGWNCPEGHGFDRFIEEKKLYPVTLLKSLTEEERDKLSDNGILTLRQLVRDRFKIVNISESRISKLVEEAEKILERC
ncbi:MAG: ATP cone domain-containing protein [Candidatus Bathyarchaeia archaeon]